MLELTREDDPLTGRLAALCGGDTATCSLMQELYAGMRRATCIPGRRRTNGRRLKCLTVADDFTHECVDITVDHGISGTYVVRVLDQAARFRSYPRAVRTDNGPEFTSRAFIAWTQQHGIEHLLIEPGRPMQNSYIESFNGKFRASA